MRLWLLGICDSPIAGDITASSSAWALEINTGCLFERSIKKEDACIPILKSNDLAEFAFEPKSRSVSMSVNGKFVGILFVDLPRGPLHPCVGFRGRSQSVRIIPAQTSYLHPDSNLSGICSFNKECCIGKKYFCLYY